MGKVSTTAHGEEAVGAADTGVDDDDGKEKYLEAMPAGLSVDEDDDDDDDDDDDEKIDADTDCVVRGTGVCNGVLTCRRGGADCAPGTDGEKNFNKECDLTSGRVTVGREGGALTGRVSASLSAGAAAAS